MPEMSLDVLAAYMVAISAVSLVVVQVVKTSVLNRFKLDDAARLAWIQLINYLFNFGLLALVLALKGDFDPAQLLFYLAAPLAQSAGSSTVFQFIATTHAAQNATGQQAAAPGTSGGVGDGSALLSTPPNATPAPPGPAGGSPPVPVA